MRSARNVPLGAVVHPPADNVLPGFPRAARTKGKTWFPGGIRRRWKDPDGMIYEWDLPTWPHRGVRSPRAAPMRFRPGDRRPREPARPGENSRAMIYKLVAYDHTERIAAAYKIPKGQVERVKQAAGLEDRPEIVADWPLSPEQAASIGSIINKPIEHSFDYFLEPYAA
ncbi:MAG: hypothetical protein J2P48_01550 [Alphaproteobacteria bacterium]|nr:hypothetical protein [Alphaproteobacteria bacterium]